MELKPLSISWDKTKNKISDDDVVKVICSNLFSLDPDDIVRDVETLIKFDAINGKDRLYDLGIEHNTLLDPDMQDYLDGDYDTFRDFIREDYDRFEDFMNNYKEALVKLKAKGLI